MDPEGFDFIYIIDKNSVGRNGHVGVITGPVNGKWQYDSFGKPTPNHRHGQYKFDSESNALDFAKERGYTHFGRWYTTEERDCQAQKEAGAWHSGNGDNYLMKKKYKVHSTNCQALVDNMAMAAGIMDDCTYISFCLPWPIRTMSINILMADESGELGQ